MTPPSFVAAAPWAATNTGSGVEASHPAKSVGDILCAVYVFRAGGAADLPPRPEPPAGWADGPQLSGQTEPLSAAAYADFGRTGMFFQRVTRANYTTASTVFTCDQIDTVGPSSVFGVMIFSVAGASLSGANGFIIESFTRSATQTTGPGNIPEQFAGGEDRGVFQVAVMNQFEFQQDGASGDYSKVYEARDATGRGASVAIFYTEADATVPEVADPGFEIGFEPTYGLTVYGFTLQPAPLPTDLRPAIPDPSRLSLDCADEYQVFITSGDYRTRLHAVQYSSIRWTRVLDEISECDVVLPDTLDNVRCLSAIRGLRTWRYGLIIERNSQEVWSGPVTSVQRNPSSIGEVSGLQVSAMDVLARFKRRLATDTDIIPERNWEAGELFAAVVESAARADDLWSMAVPEIITGQLVTREVVPRDGEQAWDVLKDIFDAAVDGYVMNGLLYLFEPVTGWRYVNQYGATENLAGPASASGEFIYGLFTENAWSERPGWSINGMTQVNRAWVAAADSGEYGFRNVWVSQADASVLSFDGILDEFIVDTLYKAGTTQTSGSESSFQRHADSIVALRAVAPAVVTGVPLAQGAPIDIENLRPGSLWSLDIHDAGFEQLLQMARLKSVEVTVGFDGGQLVETITPTLQPMGWTD